MEQEILVTGIKVVDLLAPYAKGGKIGEWMIKISEFCNFDLRRVFSVCVTLICFMHGVSTNVRVCILYAPRYYVHVVPS